MAPPTNVDMANQQIASRAGFKNYSSASERGYVWENYPKVKPFPGVNLQLQLAIDTSQLGRTFQVRNVPFYRVYLIKKFFM